MAFTGWQVIITPKQEWEATVFAFELLMPVKFVKDEITKMGKSFDIAEEKPIKELAKVFKVPMTLMAIRIGQLKERGEL